MAYKSGNVTFVKPLYGAFTLIRNFVCGFPENDDPVFTPNSPRPLNSMLYYFGEKVGHAFTAGTWTITCTTATPGAAEFSVSHSNGTGPYAGPFPDAIENVYYDEAEVCFMISPDDVVDYVVGDKYDVVTTGLSVNTTPWLLHKMVAPTTNTTYCQMEGPGLNANQHINVIMQPYSSGSTYLIGFRFAKGYLDEYPAPYDPENQTGVDNNERFMAVESSANYGDPSPFSLPYYIFCNGQRFIILITANTTSRAAYCGYFYPYGSPGQYNFPMYIGAEQNGTTYPYTSSDGRVRSFVDPGYGSARIALPGSTYSSVYHYTNSSNATYTTEANQIWPFGSEYGKYFYQNLI